MADSLLIRPAALFLGVLVLPDPVWGMLAGKIVADLVFYAIAAGAFTLTDRAGPARRATTGRGGEMNAAATRRERRAARTVREVRLAEASTLLAGADARAALALHGTPLMLLEPDRVRVPSTGGCAMRCPSSASTTR